MKPQFETTILYLHDFGGTGTGEIERQMMAAFDGHLDDWTDSQDIINVLIPKYDYWDADRSFEQINDVFETNRKTINWVVGMGLGGFWANRIAEKSTASALLINPHIFPSQSLDFYFGFHQDLTAKRQIKFTRKDMEQFEKYELQTCNGEKSAFLSIRDEVVNPQIALDYLQNRPIVWDNEEKHFVSDFEKIKKLTQEMIYTCGG